MKKRNIVVGNWKMNPATAAEAKKIFSGLKAGAKDLKRTDVIVCTPFIYTQSLSKLNRPKNMQLGVQNISNQEKGSFTGEISAEMVADAGATYVIIGHSERRAMGEDNKMIREKLDRVFEGGLKPVLCIGEDKRDKDGAYLALLKSQLKECLAGIQKKHLLGLIIAYEPVWAIGKSGKEAMSSTDIHETSLFIKKSFGEIFGKDMALSLKIIYGGSVDAENVGPMVEYGGVDGFLPGRASLDPAQFKEILKATDKKR